jgi:hypothetical protein
MSLTNALLDRIAIRNVAKPHLLLNPKFLDELESKVPRPARGDHYSDL